MNTKLILLTICISLSSCATKGQSSADEKTSSGTNPDSLRLSLNSGIRCIIEDQHGNVWFGSHDNGLARFDGDSITYYSYGDGLSHSQVRFMHEDADGNIWFECGYGLSRFDGEKVEVITDRDYRYLDEWGYSETDRWFKSDPQTGFNEEETGPGVYRLHNGQLQYHLFPQKFLVYEGNSYSVSTSFVRDQTGTNWIGTYGSVIGYNGESFTLLDHDAVGLTEATGYLHVRALFVDRENTLWIGNNGLGLWKYDGDTAINVSQRDGLFAEDSGRNGSKSPNGTLEHVFAVAEDAEGNLWAGDRDTGAWVFDGETWTNYGEEDGLTAPFVMSIYQSKSGKIWIGMEDGSVLEFNGEGFDRVF